MHHSHNAVAPCFGKEVPLKVWIDRDPWESNLAGCESCFGQFVIAGVPEHACILAYQDDSSETLTILLRSGEYYEKLVMSPTMREGVACDGWSPCVSFEPRLHNNECPECLGRDLNSPLRA